MLRSFIRNFTVSHLDRSLIRFYSFMLQMVEYFRRNLLEVGFLCGLTFGLLWDVLWILIEIFCIRWNFVHFCYCIVKMFHREYDVCCENMWSTKFTKKYFFFHKVLYNLALYLAEWKLIKKEFKFLWTTSRSTYKSKQRFYR